MINSDSHDSNKLSLMAQTVAAGIDSDSVQNAMRELDPVIRRLASQVCSVYSPDKQWIKDDYVDQAPSLVYELLVNANFDPSRGSFKAWCHVVLRTRYMSEWRKQKRHRAVSLDGRISVEEEGRLEMPAPSSGPAEQVCSMEYWLEPFTHTALRKIQHWPPRHRIIVLTLALLWRRVPPDLWSTWCSDCGILDAFPPPEFLSLTPSYCQELLANTLGITIGNLYVLKHRLIPRLFEIAPDSPAAQSIRQRPSRSRREGGPS